MRTFTEFFGFRQDPFKRTPDIEFYYTTNAHAEALENLNYLIFSEEPFAVVTGEPGTGKTITIKKFLTELPNNIVSAYILFPNISAEELFYAILEDFNVPVEPNLSKNSLYLKIREFLLKNNEEGKKALVVIDEAQNLSNETLEELRLLSNIETEKEKLLKIVLAGQPELDDKLNSEELRQFKQRVTLYTQLGNIKIDEIKSYINSHLEKAGRGRIKIQSSVIKRLATYTKGNPRLINILMEKTIIAAFLDNSHTITEHHLITAISSLNNVVGSSDFIKIRKSKLGKYLTSAAIIILCGTVAYFAADKFYLQNKDYGTNKIASNNDFLNENSFLNDDNNHQIDSIQNEDSYKESDNNYEVAQNNNTADGSNTNQEEPKREVQYINGEIVEVANTDTNKENDKSNANAIKDEAIDNNKIVQNNDPQTLIEKNSTSSDDQNIQPETPVVKEDLKFAVIKANKLNIRSAPDFTGVKVGSAIKGNSYRLLSVKGEWVEIMVSDDLSGWVYKMYIDIINKPS